MKSRIVAAAAAALVLMATPSYAGAGSNLLTDSRAHAGEVPNIKDTDQRVGTRGWRSSIFMVGDSVTHLGLHEGLQPLKLAVGWEVSAVPGRDVSTLPYYLRDRVAAQGTRDVIRRVRRKGRHPKGKRFHLVHSVEPRYPIKTAVIALGTNASTNWQYDDLRAAVDLLPTDTVVVFVTPYRDATLWPDTQPFRTRASVMPRYVTWEKRIAQLRPHTCIADWADFVTRYPQVVHDGVHETGSGAQAWARLVSGAVAACV